MKKRPNKGLIYLRWKRKDSIAIITIISLGLVMTSIGFLYPNFYSLFISLCLGFFIGGLLLSLVSTFLAQMESNITGAGEIDAEVDIDIDAEVDIDIDAEVDIDIDAEVDIDADMDAEMEIEIDSDTISTITPAPIMLLFSTAFLVYGISGLSIYFLIRADLRFVAFFAAPVISFLSIKFINLIWKMLAKSRYYRISSTKNLIGIEGEVILRVDRRGGVLKVPSNTPMKFERLHVKPVLEESIFERGNRVYICDVKNGFLLVDNKRESIRKRR
jgi:hypothetical protein